MPTRKTDSIYCWIERLAAAATDTRRRASAVCRCDARPQAVALAGMSSELPMAIFFAPRENSLLQRLWPAVEDECRRALSERAIDTAAVARRSDCLQRMTSRCEACRSIGHFRSRRLQSTGTTTRRAAAELAIEFSWAGETARRIGTVVHRWLQRIGEDALQRLERRAGAGDRTAYRARARSSRNQR